MSNLALSIRALAKTFAGSPVLTGLDLDVPAGGLIAVLGPSGSGKTTLLRLIAGFEHVDAGTISLHGTAVATDATHAPPERRRLGYVPQEGALFPHLTVARNIAFGLPRGRTRRRRVEELLELVGLANFASRMPHELSGGEQQRVALARALAPAPTTVLLDEPFSALDPALRASLRADIHTALRATGTSALLVTHDQQEALSLADQVGVLRGGRLVQTTDPTTLYRDPIDAEIAQFVGDAILLPAQLADGHAECALGRLPLRGCPAQTGAATAMIRPEQLRLHPGAGSATARVIAISYYGHDADVRLALPTANGASCELTARGAGHTIPAVGQTVRIAVEGTIVAYPARAAHPPAAASHTALNGIAGSPSPRAVPAPARRAIAAEAAQGARGSTASPPNL